MVTELRDLLHAAAEHPDNEPIDSAYVLGLARRRVQSRRRRFVAIGTAAVAACALVAVTVTVNTNHADSKLPTADVVSLQDAVDAKEGVDFEAVWKQSSKVQDGPDSRVIRSITADGLIVYTDGRRNSAAKTGAGMLDPATGSIPKQFGPEIAQTDAVVSDGQWIVLVGTGPRKAMVVYNRDGDEVTRVSYTDLGVTLDDPTISIGGIGNDKRLYFTVATDGDLVSQPTLMSLPLEGISTGTRDARSEGSTRLFAVNGDVLAYLTENEVGDPTIAVRDLASGDVSTFDPDLDSDCEIDDLGVGDAEIVLTQSCGKDGVHLTDEIRIFTVAGLPTATIEAGNSISGGIWQTTVTSSLVALGLLGHDSEQFVYEFDSGRLLRLTDSDRSVWTAGTGDLLGRTALVPGGGETYELDQFE